MKLALHWKIIIGLFLGVIWALLSSYLGWSKFTIDWISPFGTIFINVLKLIAVPLVLFSIIKGITGLTDASSLGRMGMKTLLMYLITTITAVSLGLTLVNVFQPGTLMGEGQRLENRKNYELFVAQTDGVELIDNQVLSEGSLNEV
ncbi:MAG: Na+/H+-dicarboxylate symporter, partial [Sphingobacteriales bacterium]